MIGKNVSLARVWSFVDHFHSFNVLYYQLDIGDSVVNEYTYFQLHSLKGVEEADAVPLSVVSTYLISAIQFECEGGDLYGDPFDQLMIYSINSPKSFLLFSTCEHVCDT